MLSNRDDVGFIAVLRTNLATLSKQNFVKWCERSVYGALCLSIALLGIGRLELGVGGHSMSAWSVSRTTLAFWLILKLGSFLRDGWRIKPDTLFAWAPLASFFLIVTLSLLPSFHSAGDFRYLAFAVAHGVMIVDIFADPTRQRWTLFIMAVSPLAFVVRGFIDAPEIFNFALAYRFDYPLDHANTAGYLLAMSIPLCLYVAQTERDWRRLLAVISCAAQIGALVLTHSRGAWLGLCMAILFLLIATKQWKALAAALALATIGAVALAPIRVRVTSVLEPAKDPALSGRLQLAEDAFRLGLEHPVLGVGYGRGRLKEALRYRDPSTPRETGPVMHTHNVYLELFAETGLLGLGIFLWLLLGTFCRLLRRAFANKASPDRLGLTLAASWAGAMAAGLGDIPFYHHEPRIFFFTLFAAALLYCDGGAKFVGNRGLEYAPSTLRT